ncbi:BPI fold-containing family C protein isoform X2 [Phacochoerus africanus]|uniref:BPI fold-containing family C protein isoform X2 n=1 Tax=Phacochoerus africanus TaxID=41426 RepID=UPI001FD9931A|nr:BPI fold-containing family C protein isoform X2 [Phacochoerus africanus]
MSTSKQGSLRAIWECGYHRGSGNNDGEGEFKAQVENTSTSKAEGIEGAPQLWTLPLFEMCSKMARVLWGCLLLWNLHISPAYSMYPGIKARATQRALDYGVQVGMEIIEQMVKKRDLPNLNGSESLEFLKVDYVNYNFTNIKINAFSFPNTSLAFVPGVGIRALTNHGTANISTDWEIKSPLFRDTGGADLFISEVYFTGNVILTRNNFGHPILKLQDCHAQVSHADVSFSGELSVLYNSFAEPMEKPILKNLNEMLCPMVTSEVEALNANLSMLEVITKIDNYTLLDYSLISSPDITENYIELYLKGVFYPLGNLTDPPFSSVPFVLPDRSDSMLYIGISEYFFKSASYAYFTAGAFNITLSTKEITDHLIRTSQGLGNVLSRIAELYILSQPFMVRVMATEPPLINLLPGNFTLDIPASILILTQSKNSTAETIVSMDFVASTDVALVILGQRLICSLSLNRFRLSLPESNRSNIEGFLLISTDLKYETSLKQQPSLHGWESLNLISGLWRGKPAP